jgi:hypothetical protein
MVYELLRRLNLEAAQIAARSGMRILLEGMGDLVLEGCEGSLGSS